ncbi:MAG: dihydropteroate synthase [Thermodesulfovibrio sp.]|jgi:dihydropteroate synthase|uniref:dihydropteroate synthase n=1 Tax=unclassified Thermodesulfovibrio TaxID=2645936 RepID=UPI00083A59BE|nr:MULTISPECIES: dihydropteroate synthase [unclassified Thermodesulfovibrio]MDI6714729.1 dihydropteroate synthase [Thermodesulfovibrio sp.]ODA44036.1 Dihydropteroate synthase [Thermodesulfovibrio sp. N1]
MKISFRNFLLDFSKKTYIMGILNVTPDSFFDGGKYINFKKAVERGLQLAEEGADIIDIGGESTRPGAEPLSVDEELKRVIPVIENLSKKINIPISIDTYKAKVAEEAINAGATIINDISGLRFDPQMPYIASKYDTPVVIMHIKGTPKNMQINPVYDALIPEIIEYLRNSIVIAKNAGVKENNIIIDPGIGFGKKPEHNLLIIKNLKEFANLGKPILIGVSRKSFIGKILDNAPAEQRLEGTMAAVAVSVINGANIVRVHDVKEIVKVVKVVDAIKFGRIPTTSYQEL